jgi:hypothetical protein
MAAVLDAIGLAPASALLPGPSAAVSVLHDHLAAAYSGTRRSAAMRRLFGSCSLRCDTGEPGHSCELHQSLPLFPDFLRAKWSRCPMCHRGAARTANVQSSNKNVVRLQRRHLVLERAAHAAACLLGRPGDEIHGGRSSGAGPTPPAALHRRRCFVCVCVHAAADAAAACRCCCCHQSHCRRSAALTAACRGRGYGRPCRRGRPSRGRRPWRPRRAPRWRGSGRSRRPKG